jgi:hypothetical protein
MFEILCPRVGLGNMCDCNSWNPRYILYTHKHIYLYRTASITVIKTEYTEQYAMKADTHRGACRVPRVPTKKSKSQNFSALVFQLKCRVG